VKEGSNEPIKHGGCLGLGLAAMGTRRADVYEQLKFTLYQVKTDLLSASKLPTEKMSTSKLPTEKMS
jgi:hypothetical protein